MYGHCSMVKHLLQVYHCDLHAKDEVSSVVIMGRAESWVNYCQSLYVCLNVVECAVWLHSASWCCMRRKCGAGEVVGRRKGFERARVERGNSKGFVACCVVLFYYSEYYMYKYWIISVKSLYDIFTRMYVSTTHQCACYQCGLQFHIMNIVSYTQLACFAMDICTGWQLQLCAIGSTIWTHWALLLFGTELPLQP